MAPPWVELRVKSLSYHDVNHGASSKPSSSLSSSSATMADSKSQQQQQSQHLTSSSYSTAMHKALDLTRISIAVGGGGTEEDEDDHDYTAATSSSRSTMLVLLDGVTRIRMRAIEYENNTSPRNKQRQEASSQLQQDLEVFLGQRLNIFLDQDTLQCVHRIVASLQPNDRKANSALQPSRSQLHQSAHARHHDASVSSAGLNHNHFDHRGTIHDEEDVKAIEGIVREQYQEARLHAERNEVRGGLLLPTSTEDGEVSFDAFFDANDQSFYRYSHMMTSQSQAATSNSAPNFVHTKVRCHLNSARAKVVFGSASARIEQSEESYMLLTMSDMQLSSTLSSSFSNHVLSVSHFEIESARAPNEAPQNLQVVSILSFPSSDNMMMSTNASSFGELDDQESRDEEVLLQAPCISVSVATKTHIEERDDSKNATDKQKKTATTASKHKVVEVDVDVDIEPFVLSCPVSLMGNISTFASNALPQQDNEEVVQQTQNTSAAGQHHKESNSEKRISLRCSCPNLDIAIPLGEGDISSNEVFLPLFDRCGVPVSHFVVNHSAIGVHLERLCIASSVGTSKANGSPTSSLETTFQRILCYTYLHSRVDNKHRLLDMVAFSGERKPAVFRISKIELQDDADEKHDDEPILLFAKNIRSKNTAVNGFPSAPAISSFKAFQEDDDDESAAQIFSHSDEFDLASRRELRGPDPQPQMIEEVAKATSMIELEIPQISCDLTVDEITILFDALAQALSPKPSSNERGGYTKTEKLKIGKTSAKSIPGEVVSINITCNQLCFGLHGETNCSKSLGNSDQFSYLLKLGQLRAHMLQNDGRIQHIRVMAHDLALHEAVNLVQDVTNAASDQSLLAEDRAERVRGRLRITLKTKLTPLIHRSHLFAPISRRTPAILIDILDLSGVGDFSQKSVYFTLYDLTHRFDYDSKWIERVKSLVQRLPRKTEVGGGDENASESLTKIFFCVADCNIDYTSSYRFKTASRLILRLGEVRVSCNLVQPSPSLQAIKLSVGDVSLCLCNSRFPYRFEDSKIIGVDQLNQMEEIALAKQSEDDVQREMNFKTVVMLDSLDAVLTLASGPVLKSNTHPNVGISLSAGEFSVFACKDSFAIFSSSVGELCAEACAMNDETYQKLKKSSNEEGPEAFFDSTPHDDEEPPNESQDTLPSIRLEDLMKQSALRPAVGTANSSAKEPSFMLDGYDWTTIDQDEFNACSIPRDDEQSARWYGSDKTSSPTIYRTGSHDESDAPKENNPNPFNIISHHFPLQPTSDPLGDGDMGALNYAGTVVSPPVKTRVAVSDLAIKIRLFDGYDWPEYLHEKIRTIERKGSFLIDLDAATIADLSEPEPSDSEAGKREEPDRKAALMAGLLDSGPALAEPSKTFQDILLPEERRARLKAQAEVRRLGRRSDKYFQFSATGIQIRNDSMVETAEHRLASCLNVKLQDFFVAETISSNKPIKMAGEWFNDIDHPRDTKDGLFMMKMVTWNAKRRVAPDGSLMADECEAAVKILPLRCFLDQKAIRFVGAFFRSDSLKPGDEEVEQGGNLPTGLRAIPTPTFVKFVSKPLKLKVNYKPEKLDQDALRNGQIVELLNLSPLESLVITLKQVDIQDVVGFGGVISILVPTWVQHVSSTQLIKFLEYSRPLEPLTQIGGGISDMLVLPLEAIRKGGDVQRAVRAGASSFGRAFAYEALTLTSGAAELVAAAGGAMTGSSPAGTLLPSRPSEVPTGITDTAHHVVESLSRGFQAANTRIVIIPFREYERNGTTGMVTSAVRGIPVALTAPASGAAEAISYALIGMRNSLRPDIRREEEVSQRGLRFDG